MPGIWVVLKWDHTDLYYVFLSSRANSKIGAVPWVGGGSGGSDRELQGFPLHLGGKQFATLQPNTDLANICCLVIHLDTSARCTLWSSLLSDTFLKVWNAQKLCKLQVPVRSLQCRISPIWYQKCQPGAELSTTFSVHLTNTLLDMRSSLHAWFWSSIL